MNNKKRIGVIGGVGPQATAELYRLVMELSQKDCGVRNNDEYPDLLIRSLPVPDFISDTARMDRALVMLRKAVDEFERLGLQKFCIASNTVHLLADEMTEGKKIKLISMVEAVVGKVKAVGFKRVGILATPVTIQRGLYRDALDKQGVEAVDPSEQQLVVVDEIIRGVLAGEKNDHLEREYVKIIDEMFSCGVEGIVLGCTELPLAINYQALGDRVVRSLDLLAENVVDYLYH